MDPLKAVLGGYLRGVRDSLVGFVNFKYYDTVVPETTSGTVPSTNLARRRAAQQAEKRQQKQAEQNELVMWRFLAALSVHANHTRDNGVKVKLYHCVVLNGIVMVLCMVFFQYLIVPFLQCIYELVMGPLEEDSYYWPYLTMIYGTLFMFFWVFPIFVVSRFVNTFWFQEIADSAYIQRQGQPQPINNYSKHFADMIISCIIQVLFLIQSSLMTLIPVSGLGMFLSFIHLAVLNSLYAFEYRWFNMRWQLDKRLRFIEENWPYFLGFGSPLSATVMYGDSYYFSGCLFAMTFPIYILSANEAEPIINNSVIPIRFFSIVVGVSDRIVEKVFGQRPPQTPSKTLTSSSQPHTPTSHRSQTRR